MLTAMMIRNTLDFARKNVPITRPEPLDNFPRLDEYNAWSRVTEHKGDWMVCSPETVKLFSAVGYIFGRRLHLVEKVPIGLVDTSWGGARPALYTKTFAALIPEWRRAFCDETLPFGICQMVSWGFPPEIEYVERDMASPAPDIRKAQLKAHLAHPDTGFVVACDLGHIQMHSPFKTPHTGDGRPT
ncbi:MAG: hypothetical protein GY809_06130 [Planctomycetes bacterium]|nr:hypothetical protein [Planctomycetota bacterium]